MSDVDTDKTQAQRFTAPLQDGQTSAEHDAWMKAEIRGTLARKKAGTITYRTLDEVMRKFGFNAR